MNKFKLAKTIFFIFFMILIMAAYGCTLTFPPKQTAVVSEMQPASMAPPTIKEFSDISVPRALKLDNKSSYVIETSNFATGVLVYRGRIMRDAVVDFFKKNMVQDNWRFITSLKSPQTNTMMLFNKEPRWCIINIMENNIGFSYVEIGVVPTSEDVSGDDNRMRGRSYVPVIEDKDDDERIIE